MKSFAAALVLFALSAAANAAGVQIDSPPHDCCWGPGCGVSNQVHQNEELTHPIGCSNHHIPGGVGPTIGHCESDYVGPSKVGLVCDITGCVFKGNFRCSNGVYPVHPPVYLDCPGKTVNGQWEMPAVSGDQTRALCVYSDGSGYYSECNSAGGTTSGPL